MVADRLIGDIEAAGRVAQGGVTELLESTESKLVDRMIQDHRANKLSPNDALVRVGVLSELRAVRAEIQRTLLRGTEAARKLTER